MISPNPHENVQFRFASQCSAPSVCLRDPFASSFLSSSFQLLPGFPFRSSLLSSLPFTYLLSLAAWFCLSKSRQFRGLPSASASALQRHSQITEQSQSEQSASITAISGLSSFGQTPSFLSLSLFSFLTYRIPFIQVYTYLSLLFPFPFTPGIIPAPLSITVPPSIWSIFCLCDDEIWWLFSKCECAPRACFCLLPCLLYYTTFLDVFFHPHSFSFLNSFPFLLSLAFRLCALSIPLPIFLLWQKLTRSFGCGWFCCKVFPPIPPRLLPHMCLFEFSKALYVEAPPPFPFIPSLHCLPISIDISHSFRSYALSLSAFRLVL